MAGDRVAATSPPRPQPGFLGWLRSSLTDPVSWRACAYLLLKLPITLLGAIGVIYVVAWGFGYTTFPFWWQLIHQLIHQPAAHGDTVQVPGWLAWWKPNPVLVAQAIHPFAWSFALIPAGLAALLAREKLGGGVGPAAGGAPGSAAEIDLARALEPVDAAHRSAKEAIIELRDLACGIHPPVLDHGLGTALATLAARSGLPVEVIADLPATRERWRPGNRGSWTPWPRHYRVVIFDNAGSAPPRRCRGRSPSTPWPTRPARSSPPSASAGRTCSAGRWAA
jgi:hypothetical protein